MKKLLSSEVVVVGGPGRIQPQGRVPSFVDPVAVVIHDDRRVSFLQTLERRRRAQR